jgi:FkbM family methyltransferase
MENNHYDFIEIGTSDFDTFIQNDKYKDCKGISIEPVKTYIDKLPDRKNITKLQRAISNTNGTCDVYYVLEEKFSKYGLESWAKGCNSINSYHPTVENWLIRNDFDPKEVFSKDTIKMCTLTDIINEFKITSLDTLKIDTEGHDTVILNHYFDNCKVLAKNIQFECNQLSSILHVQNVLNKALKLGYKIIKYDPNTDCVLSK